MKGQERARGSSGWGHKLDILTYGVLCSEEAVCGLRGGPVLFSAKRSPRPSSAMFAPVKEAGFFERSRGQWGSPCLLHSIPFPTL